MKIIIHMGMHKTGSSAIQGFLHSSRLSRTMYAKWTGPNHCGLFILLFEDPDKMHSYHGFKARGPEFLKRLPELRQVWREKIDAQLEVASDRNRTFIFSAEDISSPEFSNARKNMADYFRKWTDDIMVIGYVRGPTTFAKSAFQQILKDGGTRELLIDKLWPEYRDRFEHMFDLFGPRNICIRPFLKEHLYKGDVVADFCRIAGLEVGTSYRQMQVDNLSLSAEATALLFLQRKMGAGYVSGFPSAQKGNNRFAQYLSQIGTRGFSFHPEVWVPVLEQNIEDLKWIENKLGMKLQEKANPDDFLIKTESDLIKLGLSQIPRLKEMLNQAANDVAHDTEETALVLLEAVRALAYIA